MEPASSSPAFSFSSSAQQPSSGPSAANQEGRSLYVGHLDPKVNEALLWEFFSETGPVESCKIIKDRSPEKNGYGFVDYFRREDAELAVQRLNGKKIYDVEIKVNWAVHCNRKEDPANHFNIFVGDLSSEVTNEALHAAFEPFGSISDARVMWDQGTGRSRGYGFVAFREKPDAERAMAEMDGTEIGNRAVRCNWANQKTNSRSSASGGQPKRAANFEDVAGQSAQSNTTVYVGNLPVDTLEPALRASFQPFGAIEEIRIQAGRCFGFVRFQNHEQATRAIIASHDMTIGGQPIRCSWGKQKAAAEHSAVAAMAQGYPPAMYGAGQYYPQQGYPMYPYYGAQAPYYQPHDPAFYAQAAYDPYAYAMQYQHAQPPQMPQGHMPPQYMNYPPR